MIPIAEAVRRYRRIVAIMGSQMGKTAGVFNIIGHKLDDDPAPCMYVGPTKSNIDGVIEPQLAELFRSSESLRSKMSRGKRSKYVKRIAGVTLRLAWAGSPTELASQYAHTVVVDELDRMKAIPGEGDPLGLAEARIATYPDGRIVATSTPTEGNVEVMRDAETGFDHWKVADGEELISPIWKLFQEGTRFEWAVPCPECADYFVPRFRLLTWPKECSPKRALKEARLACARCGALIEDQHRHGMNARGLYVAPGQKVVDGVVIGDPPESDTASFWASGLMSPWRSWGQRAASYIRAIRSADQDRIRTVVNTEFGELFAFRGDAPTHDEVRARCANYASGEVPEGARLLVAFVDVQKRKLVYVVRAFGYALESWLVEADEILGDTDVDSTWQQLGELLERRWSGLAIRRMGIDSGYRPGDKWRRPDNLIYSFCRQYRGLAVPTKGRDRMTKPISANLIDVTVRGKTVPKGLTLWHLDTDYFKSWVHARLAWPEGTPGAWHVPRDVSDDYCMQVTAEARTLKPSGHAVWIRLRRENHFLDCEAGVVAMAMSLGAHRKLKRERASEAEPSESPTIEAPPPQVDKPAAAPVAPVEPARPRRVMFPRTNFVTGWRR